MYSITEFINWALGHAQPGSVPEGAAFPDGAEPAADPWQYLFGSIMVRTTQATLDRYFADHYSKQMTRAEFDRITASWSRSGYATDCEGLLDAWLTYFMDDPTDLNSDGNYRLWCTEKGLIDEIRRPYKIGEAVFRQGAEGRMTHVGWICGFLNGEPLVVEARGIRFGVVVSELKKRSFTHRGLMTAIFDYGEDKAMPIHLELTSPYMRSDAVFALQFALNELGYTDADGRRLTEDGKLGPNTMFAVEEFANNQQTICRPNDSPLFLIPSENGDYRLRVTVEAERGL